MSLLHNFSLYRNLEPYSLLLANHGRLKAVVFDSNAITVLKSSEEMEKAMKVYTKFLDVYGSLGVLNISSGNGHQQLYLVLVTGCITIAKFSESEIYRITSTTFLSLSGSVEDDERLAQLRRLLNSGTFYFFWPTNGQQAFDFNTSAQRCHSTEPLTDSIFFWNRFLYEQVKHYDANCSDWLMKIIHGSVEIRTVYAAQAQGRACLISRVGFQHADWQHDIFGINDTDDKDRHILNVVETEQVIYIDDKICSFVQTHGTLPLFHDESKEMGPNQDDAPNGALSTWQVSVSSFQQHIASLQEEYGRIVLVNLISGKDGNLKEAFKTQHMASSLHDDVPYFAFDYDAESYSTSTTSLARLTDILATSIDDFGFFYVQESEIKRKQAGTLRISCTDNFDHSNAAQCIIGLQVLPQQLESLGLADKPQMVSRFVEVYKQMWQLNGDHVRRACAGSAILSVGNQPTRATDSGQVVSRTEVIHHEDSRLNGSSNHEPGLPSQQSRSLPESQENGFSTQATNALPQHSPDLTRSSHSMTQPTAISMVGSHGYTPPDSSNFPSTRSPTLTNHSPIAVERPSQPTAIPRGSCSSSGTESAKYVGKANIVEPLSAVLRFSVCVDSKQDVCVAVEQPDCEQGPKVDKPRPPRPVVAPARPAPSRPRTAPARPTSSPSLAMNRPPSQPDARLAPSEKNSRCTSASSSANGSAVRVTPQSSKPSAPLQQPALSISSSSANRQQPVMRPYVGSSGSRKQQTRVIVNIGLPTNVVHNGHAQTAEEAQMLIKRLSCTVSGLTPAVDRKPSVIGGPSASAGPRPVPRSSDLSNKPVPAQRIRPTSDAHQPIAVSGGRPQPMPRTKSANEISTVNHRKQSDTEQQPITQRSPSHSSIASSCTNSSSINEPVNASIKVAPPKPPRPWTTVQFGAASSEFKSVVKPVIVPVNDTSAFNEVDMKTKVPVAAPRITQASAKMASPMISSPESVTGTAAAAAAKNGLCTGMADGTMVEVSGAKDTVSPLLRTDAGSMELSGMPQIPAQRQT